MIFSSSNLQNVPRQNCRKSALELHCAVSEQPLLQTKNGSSPKHAIFAHFTYISKTLFSMRFCPFVGHCGACAAIQGCIGHPQGHQLIKGGVCCTLLPFWSWLQASHHCPKTPQFPLILIVVGWPEWAPTLALGHVGDTPTHNVVLFTCPQAIANTWAMHPRPWLPIWVLLASSNTCNAAPKCGLPQNSQFCLM